MTTTTASVPFELNPGRMIANKYEVIEQLGEGWEGEVYKIREIRTGIEHAAKLFYPIRDPKNKAVVAYAKKLHNLRRCSMVIRYHTEETIRIRGQNITVLIAEFADGIMLEDYIKKQPGKRLRPYEALHMLYALASGMQEIHDLGEYHGDLHTENVMVSKVGVRIELKLLDMYFWGKPHHSNIKHDTVEIIRIFYDSLGGAKHYSTQPVYVKKIICGMKTSLILKKYNSASQLKRYLDKLELDL